MARTKRRTQQWFMDYWFFGETELERKEHMSKMQRDKNAFCWSGIPREFRKRFNKAKRYHDKREIKRVLDYECDDNFSQWKRDAGYWWW